MSYQSVQHMIKQGGLINTAIYEKISQSNTNKYKLTFFSKDSENEQNCMKRCALDVAKNRIDAQENFISLLSLVDRGLIILRRVQEIHSGAPAAPRAAKWGSILIQERKGNP